MRSPLLHKSVSRKPEAESRQPEAESRQPGAESRQPEAESRKSALRPCAPLLVRGERATQWRGGGIAEGTPEAGSRKPPADSGEPKADYLSPYIFL